VASGDQSVDREGQSLGKGIIDLEEAREEVVKEVFNAPKRRVDNEISRLSDNISVLHMHGTIVNDLVQTFRRAMWKSRLMTSGSFLLTAGSVGGAFYFDLPLQTMGTAGALGGLTTLGMVWWQNSALTDLSAQLARPESAENSFRKQYHRKIADKDEFVLSLWARVKEHLRVGLSAEDVRTLKPLSAGDISRLERLMDHEIPELRRDAQPSFNR
jgi:hypothetical protein